MNSNGEKNEVRRGNSVESVGSDHDSEECEDTLGPLPSDLLVHPHELVDLDDDLAHSSSSSFSSSGPRTYPQSSESENDHDRGAPTTTTTTTTTTTAPASKRRSVSAGSGRPIFPVNNPTKQDLEHARRMLLTLREEHGFSTPDRGDLDDPSVRWKAGRRPDYTIADLHFLLGKTRDHPPDSVERYVEEFVKRWEMEATHKEFAQWTTADQLEYSVQANGGRVYRAEEAEWVGNYNWLLSTCRKDLYDASEESFESSHGKFRYAFPEGFPFEVLEVYAGPPKIAFSWRHWATFSGVFEGHQGGGETVNMTGFGVVNLNEEGRAKRIEIYYDPDSFLEVLRGVGKGRDGGRGVAFGEPVAGGTESMARMMAAIELEEIEGSDSDGRGTPRTDRAEGRREGKCASGGRCPFSGSGP